MIVLKIAAVFLVFDVATQGCPIQTIPSERAQRCLSPIGFVNPQTESDSNICRVYEEMLQCVQTYIQGHGLNCTKDDLAKSLSVMIPDIGFNFTKCNVTDEIGSICPNKDRLAKYVFLACSPYLNVMQAVGDNSLICAYMPTFMNCAIQGVHFIDTSCSQQDISAALGSSSSSSLLAASHPGLDLSQCFQTESVKDNACTNHMKIFSYPGVQQCTGVVGYINITNPNELSPASPQCGLIQEVESCMVKALLHQGFNCSMSDMKTVISAYIKLSPPDNVVKQLSHMNVCPVNDSYVMTSICNSENRLIDFFSISATSVFQSMDMLTSMKDYVCNSLKSYFRSFLQPLGVNCTFNQTLTALLSSDGNSTFLDAYPNLDLNHCSMMSGGA
ncbi:hypothetical protein ACF0H5_022780 [Mactra antiquata]